MKVKTILVSQPEPKVENSPYLRLVEKQKIKVDFRPFIHVEGVNARDVRQQKIDLTQFTAIILTSRNAVDHFFRIAEEMRFKVPDSMKYFCQSEAVAFYLQKYVVYRKRKIYVGEIINEVFSGQGILTKLDGTKHVGEFKEGKYHGQGTHTKPDGEKYEGEWKDGKLWNGTVYDKNGTIIGKWVNGVKQK